MESYGTVKALDRVGAIFLLRKDGATLMQLRDEIEGLRHAGVWVSPGGHAQPGENIEACARREFFEETNYWCNTLNWLTEFRDAVSDSPEYILTIYWELYDSKQELICNEGQDLKFIGRNEVDKYFIPSYLI